MISLSILLKCSPDSVGSALAGFGILPEDISSYEKSTAEFLTQQRNGALIFVVSGDFTYAADLFLYNVDPAELESLISAISCQNVGIAIPADHSPDPEIYQYWQMGQQRTVRVADLDGIIHLIDLSAIPATRSGD